jgi:hypothetical protein
MSRPIHILLQTAIEHSASDWHIGRFSMLRDYLTSPNDTDGSPVFQPDAAAPKCSGVKPR